MLPATAVEVSTRRQPSARLSLFKPSRHRIRDFVALQRELDLSYAQVGVTRELDKNHRGAPLGDFNVDTSHERLGTGQRTYACAVKALSRWAMFDVGWVELCWPNTRICSGSAVAVLARAAAGWVLNASRIVYVVSDEGDVERFGFATGTLPGHMMRGEERFTIEWNRRTDAVVFEIVAVSRPHHLLSWMSYPMIRSLQRRFRRDAGDAMHRAVR